MSAITGVVSQHSLDMDALNDATISGVNLTFDNFISEHPEECDDEECKAENHENAGDRYEADSEEFLIGGWIATPNRAGGTTYNIDREAEFSAIYNSGFAGGVVQVVHSKRVTSVRSMCSPCFPGQANLDSAKCENGFDAYDLPEGFYAD